MPDLVKKADELRLIIEAWARENNLTTKTQHLVAHLSLEIIEFPKAVVDRIPKAFENEWDIILRSKLSDDERNILYVFVGRENRPLSSKDFRELVHAELAYAINEKFSDLYYRRSFNNSPLWKIRRRRDVLTLDTNALPPLSNS
jgi:hypothetical protein